MAVCGIVFNVDLLRALFRSNTVPVSAGIATKAQNARVQQASVRMQLSVHSISIVVYLTLSAAGDIDHIQRLFLPTDDCQQPMWPCIVISTIRTLAIRITVDACLGTSLERALVSVACFECLCP